MNFIPISVAETMVVDVFVEGLVVMDVLVQVGRQAHRVPGCRNGDHVLVNELVNQHHEVSAAAAVLFPDHFARVGARVPPPTAPHAVCLELQAVQETTLVCVQAPRARLQWIKHISTSHVSTEQS